MNRTNWDEAIQRERLSNESQAEETEDRENEVLKIKKLFLITFSVYPGIDPRRSLTRRRHFLRQWQHEQH